MQTENRELRARNVFKEDWSFSVSLWKTMNGRQLNYDLKVHLANVTSEYYIKLSEI